MSNQVGGAMKTNMINRKTREINRNKQTALWDTWTPEMGAGMACGLEPSKFDFPKPTLGQPEEGL